MYHKWWRYGPWRAITGHLSTLRAYEAARLEDRFWSDTNVRHIEKLRPVPDKIRDSNYGEWRYSWIKENRWVHTRHTTIETPEKHRRLRNRRKDRQRVQKEKAASGYGRSRASEDCKPDV